MCSSDHSDLSFAYRFMSLPQISLNYGSILPGEGAGEAGEAGEGAEFSGCSSLFCKVQTCRWNSPHFSGYLYINRS